ncbi:hypothetical protein BX600DRAFT_450592 [Xylariales sp. PMI_506]|nr:hypothetical protein BX600DRAFT_450592 [Xylariales sp. PMI_506]
MASRFASQSSYSGSSSALGQPREDQSLAPMSPDHHGSVASSIAGDADDYDNHEIQLIFDTVTRAEEILPFLPSSSRLPTNALFLAYEEILEERGIEAPDGPKLDKLLFKIGGSRYGETIADKFQDVMARMNITVHFDVPGNMGEELISDDDMSWQSDLHEYDDGDVPFDLTDEIQSIDHAAQESLPVGVLEHPAAVGSPLPESVDSLKQGNPEVREVTLQKAVLGFQRHQDKIHSITAVEKWQEKSSRYTRICKLFHDAREADFQIGFNDVVIAWNEIAVEVDEMPLDDIPANVYSKRILYLAARAHDIYTTKNALAYWRQRAAERSERNEPSFDKFLGKSVEDDLRLSKLAQRAHENLMKSRALSQWSNRAAEERRKAQFAEMAHEMALKSRAFGFRPKLDALASTIREGYEPYDGPPSEVAPGQPPQYQEPAADKDRSEPILESDARPSARRTQAILESLKRMGNPILRFARQSVAANSIAFKSASASTSSLLPPDLASSSPVEPRDEEQKGEAEEEEEAPADDYDERTMIARRHILRMRFFQSWKDYTQDHRTRVKDFTMQHTLEPWRERSLSMVEKFHDSSRRHDETVSRDALHNWAAAVAQPDGLRAIAEQTRQRNQILSVLKPWVATARQYRRSIQRQRHLLALWHDSQTLQGEFEQAASTFHKHRRLEIALRNWRIATADAVAKKQEYEGYAQRSDYYRRSHGTIQEWKARSRGNAVQMSMKRDAIDSWYQGCQDHVAREDMMTQYASRANYYYSITKSLPAWREATAAALELQQELEERCTYSFFDSSSRETIQLWRTLAKQRRKARLRQAHLEVRRLVKKGMGARCVTHWRGRLEYSSNRVEQLERNMSGVTTDRAEDLLAQSLQTWRLQAEDKSQMDTTSTAVVVQKVLLDWRERCNLHGQLETDAQEYWTDRATAKALKDWKLNSLQMDGRRSTVQKHLNKDRKLLKQSLEGWHAKTIDKLAQVPSHINRNGLGGAAQDNQNQLPGAGTRRTLFSLGRAVVSRGGTPQLEDDVDEYVDEESAYAATPGRPQLLLGELGRRQTTTPLAPIPQRQPWQGASRGPGDSILGQSASGAVTGSRVSRTRRNLRVSWAE